ncbi:MAG TPA: hypothetical protein VF173_02615 [Thermoanaerobaculia bacterium]|nr:hypothetical protein [Thermoanaerobaculia bacterium]
MPSIPCRSIRPRRCCAHQRLAARPAAPGSLVSAGLPSGTEPPGWVSALRSGNSERSSAKEGSSGAGVAPRAFAGIRKLPGRNAPASAPIASSAPAAPSVTASPLRRRRLQVARRRSRPSAPAEPRIQGRGKESEEDAAAGFRTSSDPGGAAAAAGSAEIRSESIFQPPSSCTRARVNVSSTPEGNWRAKTAPESESSGAAA